MIDLGGLWTFIPKYNDFCSAFELNPISERLFCLSMTWGGGGGISRHYDVINVSSKAILKVLHMLVNQYSFRYENIASIFI